MISKIRQTFSLFSEKEDFESVQQYIVSSVPFRGTNLWILIVAVLIASLGLNVNSTAVIIGAMLISPLMGPIMGLGFSLGTNDPSLLKNSVKNYLFATLVGLITSTVYFWLSPINEAHSEILARTAPTIYDVAIAFFGGLAGIIATSSRLKGNVIPGVAIATALMPPLCTAGFGIATGAPAYFVGALYLYLINSVYIGVATFLTVKFLKFPQHQFKNEKLEQQSRRIMWLLIVLTLVPSIYLGYVMVQKNTFERRAERFINTEAIFDNNFLLRKNINFEKGEIELIYGGEKLGRGLIEELQVKTAEYGLAETKIIVKQGFNFVPGNSKSLTSESENQVRKMVHSSDSTEQRNALVKRLFNEIRVYEENVVSLGFEPVKQVNDTLETNQDVLLVKLRSEIPTPQKRKVTDWLKLRMQNDSARVIFFTD